MLNVFYKLFKKIKKVAVRFSIKVLIVYASISYVIFIHILHDVLGFWKDFRTYFKTKVDSLWHR